MANNPMLDTTRTVGTSQSVVRSSSRCQLALRRRCGRTRPGPRACIAPVATGDRLVPAPDSSPGIAHLAGRGPAGTPRRPVIDAEQTSRRSRDQPTARCIPPLLRGERRGRILRHGPGSSAAWQRACFGSRRPRVRIPPPRHTSSGVANSGRCPEVEDLDRALAHLDLSHLAGHRHGEVLGDVDIAGNLVVGQSSCAEHP